jgi:hypothetical protein
VLIAEIRPVIERLRVCEIDDDGGGANLEIAPTNRQTLPDAALLPVA